MKYGNLCKFLIFIFIVSVGFSCTNKTQSEILWDNYGVPHIYASSADQMYYAFGRAQMESHANLILKLYSQARGNASSVFGEQYIESDRLMKLFRLDQLAEKAYSDQDPVYRKYIDAFVKGINDYAAENPNKIDEKCKRVLPVNQQDILAHTLRVICLEFLAGEDISAVKRLTEPGSNAIAIAPSRSASGKALLMSNPHLPWSDFFLWYEAHLVTKDFNLYGVSLVGMPTLTIAFNENLGWTHTVNTIDGSDRYEIVKEGENYTLDNKKIPFEKKHVSLSVLQNDGTLRTDTITLKYTLHGPVVAENGDKAWAVRIAGLENTRIFEQYHKMGMARNLGEFEAAVKMLQNPMFNIIYADRDGHIYYLFNGDVPVRKQGDFAFWRGTLPGSESDLIWDKYLPYDSLPKVIDPPAGFLQNCNDPPWVCTWPAVLDPARFPAWVAPRGMGLRPQRAVNLVLRDSSITFDELADIKLNTGLESADRYLDELLTYAEKSDDKKVSEAVRVLKAWDRKSDCNSRGTLLFAEWWDIARATLGKSGWDPEHPSTTPSGIKDPGKAVELLGSAYDNAVKKYGAADVATGDVFRIRINDNDVPSNGGPEYFGMLRAMYYAPDKDGKMRAVAGDTYYAITEFDKKVRAVAVLSYGNATQPGNKHAGDQLDLMSEKRMRPVLYYREDLEKNIEKRETIKEIF
jgi:acyl-homoserine-lactone acylase